MHKFHFLVLSIRHLITPTIETEEEKKRSLLYETLVRLRAFILLIDERVFFLFLLNHETLVNRLFFCFEKEIQIKKNNNKM